MLSATFLLAALAHAAVVRAGTYTLSDNWIGSAFLSTFQWQNIPDPTDGTVTYVTQATALSKNLTYANGNTFIMRADDTTTIQSGQPGRSSVRIMSNKQYTTHALVLDIRHMPEGCGTWPAFWEVGNNWPNGGELDIIEGVNNVVPNLSSLHTAAGCTMPASRTQTGTAVSNDCVAADNGNSGCGVQTTKANSFGPAFNNAGGGYYAVERTNSFINVWFWSRGEGGIPADVVNDGQSVNTAGWGTPVANFPSTNCNLASEFAPNNIVFDLTLCGSWAGNVFGNGDGCPAGGWAECNTYVNGNPSAFKNAYWDIAALRVYQ